MAVDLAVKALVGIRQQAVVAAEFAALDRTLRPVEVLALFVVVDDAQGFLRHLREGVLVVVQPPQHARTTLGALHEEGPAAPLGVGEVLASSSESSSWKCASIPRSSA